MKETANPETNPEKKGMRSIRVSICGEPVSLLSDQPEVVVERLADYLDQKIRDLGGAIHQDKFKVLALAAMSVTGELMELKTKLEENAQAKQDMLAQAQSLTETLDRALARAG